ncbi:putative serine/threonine-protein kinase DDB_G0267514 [Oculina patagonica]
MVNAALNDEKKKESKVASKTAKVRIAAKPKSSSNLTRVKEICPANLTRSAARSIGHGTFGTCYPGTYRGICVVIKQYNDKSRPCEERVSFLQKQAKREANVLLELGDHPGIPLFFGVCLKEEPVSIVLKFHGDGRDSLTLYKSAKTKLISEQKTWNRILVETAEALDHIHSCGYAHNDLKSNNVVLEKREDKRLHPVIIDFGNSVMLCKARNPPPKPAHLRSHYKESYIAPELVDGTGKPSIESDVYALAFLVKTVYSISRFCNVAAVINALVASPQDRPTVKELKAALSAE